MSADDFAAYAPIYDAWVATAPITRHHVSFYVDQFVKEGGHCVELGVGNGRICIEAARRGVDVTGVDVSPAMLALTRRRAEAAGVADRLALVEADMRTFVLPRRARVVSIPFSSVGHVVEHDDKRAMFRHVFDQLSPGGLFVFDTLVFDPAFAAANADVARLRAEFKDEATGRDAVLWVAPTYDVPAQKIRIVGWTDLLDADGVVTSRRYCRISFSWITPEQSRAWLADAGFVVEHAFGGFDRRPLDAASKTQIWFARRK